MVFHQRLDSVLAFFSNLYDSMIQRLVRNQFWEEAGLCLTRSLAVLRWPPLSLGSGEWWWMPFVPAVACFCHNSLHYPCSQTGEIWLRDNFWGCYSLIFLLVSSVRGQSTPMTSSWWHSGRSQFLQAGWSWLNAHAIGNSLVKAPNRSQLWMSCRSCWLLLLALQRGGVLEAMCSGKTQPRE